jgi:hypothetical protein
MKAESDSVRSRVKSLTSAAKTLKRLRAQFAIVAAQCERNAIATKEVDAMLVPKYTIDESWIDKYGHNRRRIICENSHYLAWPDEDDFIIRNAIANIWRCDKREARGYRYGARREAEDLERRIDKIEKRIKDSQ